MVATVLPLLFRFKRSKVVFIPVVTSNVYPVLARICLIFSSSGPLTWTADDSAGAPCTPALLFCLEKKLQTNLQCTNKISVFDLRATLKALDEVLSWPFFSILTYGMVSEGFTVDL